MLDLNIGLTALQSSQQAMDVIGQNIANANTPGYHAQNVQLVEASPVPVGNVYLGTGVDVTTVERLQSAILDAALASNSSVSGSLGSQLSTMNQVQSLMSAASGQTLPDLTQAFFDQVQQLTTDPSDLTQRGQVLAAANALTQQLNATAQGISGLQSGLTGQINLAVQQVNSFTQQIASLNGQIQQQEVTGQTPNALLDQRDELVQQLAGLGDIRVVDEGHGEDGVLLGGMTVVQGNISVNLAATTGANGVSVALAGSAQTPVNISSGSLGGMLQLQQQVLPGLSQQLDQFTQQLVQGVDEIQATGLGLSGPQSFISGTRGVSSTTVPLDQAGLALPAQKGSLFVTVTNEATGQSSTSQVNIDPATESLQEVANALSQVPNVQGLVNSQNGTLQIVAQAGYGVSFTSQPDSTPNSSSIGGTTSAQIGGSYTGSNNTLLTFTVSGPGTVGVTPNLTLQVQDQSGNTVATLNIGQGYTAGTPLQIGNGMTVQLAAGTVNGGDSFTAWAVAQPDTANILSALGLNTFFTGTNAADVTVNPALTNDPSLLAASTSGQPGDASNLQRLVALGNQQLLGNGTQSLSQFGTALIGQVGTQVQQLNDAQTSTSALGQQIQAQQQAVSGVDPNEQLVKLVQYQNSFQLASQYITAVNQAMGTLEQDLNSVLQAIQ